MTDLKRLIVFIANKVFRKEWVLVALRDFDGDTCTRVATRNHWGELKAERMGMFIGHGIHPVVLLDGGKIKGRHKYDYVCEWKKI